MRKKQPEQRNLFDLAAGLEARDAAMEQVAANAEPGWNTEALSTCHAVATRLPRLATDDLWEAGLPPTRENRALGPIMREACRRGWIVPLDGEDRKSKCKWQHGRPLQLYRSLIWRPAVAS